MPQITGKLVGVIGSGPAGLAASKELADLGHYVSIFEKDDKIGGLASPEHNNELKTLCDCLREHEHVRIHTNTEIGKHVPADFILKEKDAVVICTGSGNNRDVLIDGRDANGIWLAKEFLEKSKNCLLASLRNQKLVNKRVIIFGNGDTAKNCIATATSKKLNWEIVGSFEVLPQPVPERKPEDAWRQWPLVFRVDNGHEEAKKKTGSDARTYSVATKRFLTKTKSAGVKVLSGLEIVDVKWEKDDKGAWKLVEKSDTIRTIECDLCIIAMELIGPEKTVIEQLNLKTDPRFNILTPKDQYDSDVAKVFAAGDCRRGRSLVVFAIHEGREAAQQVHEYLMCKATSAGPGRIATAPIQHQKHRPQGFYRDNDPAEFDTTLDAAIQARKEERQEKSDKTVKQRRNIQKPKTTK